jgi:hypothetical protein
MSGNITNLSSFLGAHTFRPEIIPALKTILESLQNSNFVVFGNVIIGDINLQRGQKQDEEEEEDEQEEDTEDGEYSAY